MPGSEQGASRPLFTRSELLRLIIPLVIEQLLLMTVGMADTVMVPPSGEAAVSGVSLVDNINTLIIQIFSALSTGGAVVGAQYLGRREAGAILMVRIVLGNLIIGNVMGMLYSPATQSLPPSSFCTP